MRSFVDFPADELSDILSHFELMSLCKGEYLCQQGQICNYIGFIQSGIIRSYYHVKQQEITRFILTEGVFVTAFASFISRKPSREYIHAIENTSLWAIHHQDLQHLYEQYPRMQKLGRLVTEYSHILLEQRVLALLSYSAEERYSVLLREQPELVKRVPLIYIASLLGIKPETLSRIRRRKK